jgi:DNA/RNA endonuclease YhcR with UshA esterase domain
VSIREVLVFFSLAALPGWAAETVRADALVPADAAGHVGEVATVCGLVTSTKYAPQSIGAPTFLDFGGVYPHATFTALILGRDRAKFGNPEITLRGKEVCVSGEIRVYHGTPQVILTRPDQMHETAGGL